LLRAPSAAVSRSGTNETTSEGAIAAGLYRRLRYNPAPPWFPSSGAPSTRGSPTRVTPASARRSTWPPAITSRFASARPRCSCPRRPPASWRRRAARSWPRSRPLSTSRRRPARCRRDRRYPVFPVPPSSSSSIAPRLIELQGFPSLYGFQSLLARVYREELDLPEGWVPYFGGLDEARY